jgi:predicted AlkP superfamily phosphohydrolase/phosphomutase
MSRLLIIGIDSASFDLINPWVQDGKLPNFSRCLKRGVCGELQSVVPPMSPPAWTSFVTGKNPGKHGVFDFTTRKPGSYALEFVNARSRKSETIWKIMNDAGKRVCTIALPISYPPEKINGNMISGVDTPGASGGVADPSAFHPPELHAEIRKAVGPYLISPNLFALENDQCDAMVEAALETVQRKMETALYLYGKEPWDCFMVVIGETDAIAHRLWKYHDKHSPFFDESVAHYKGEDPLLRIYQRVDEYLGKLFQLAGPDTTITIMSDHGHGGNTTKAVYPNCWLESQKLLNFRVGALDKGLSSIFKGAVSKNLQWAKANALKFLPPNFKKLLLRKTNLASKIESALRFSNIDWSRTKAYSEETPYFPTIWVNLKGREPNGTVEPGREYEDVRERVIEGLHKWLDPETGRPVVKKVHKREEIYSRPYVEKFPDLIIEWNLDNGYSYIFKNSQLKTGQHGPIAHIDEEEKRRSKSGDHRDYGIFIFVGEQIKNSNASALEGVGLMDLAPTILYLSGLPIPLDMDGKVLTHIIEDEYLAAHPVRYCEGTLPDVSFASAQEDYSEEEEEVLRDRLRGLGYIE